MPTARTAHSRMDLRPGVPQAPRVHPQPRLVRHSLERAPCPRPCAAGSLRATTSTLQPFVDESNISGTTLDTVSTLTSLKTFITVCSLSVCCLSGLHDTPQAERRPHARQVRGVAPKWP